MILEKKSFFILTFFLLTLNFSFAKQPAQRQLPRQIQQKIEKIKVSKNSWYIRSASGTRCGKVIYGPFDNIDQVLCIWNFYNIVENKNNCIAIDTTFKTKKPSETYKVDLNRIKDEIKEYGETAVLERYFLQKNFDGTIIEESNSDQTKSNELTTIESFDNPEQKTETPVTVQEPVAAIEPELTSEVEPVIISEDKTKPLPEQKAIDIQEGTEVKKEIESSAKEEPVKEIQKEEQEPVEEKTTQIVKEDKSVEKSSKEPNSIFDFKQDYNSSKSSSYKKEYLMDYAKKQDLPLPSDDDTIPFTKIDNPDKQDLDGITQLMKASENGNNWEIDVLLKSGANVNIQDKDGWTALMYAARYQQNINIINSLIKAGAEIKTKNKYNISALMLAATYNSNPEILAKLLSFYSAAEKEVLQSFVFMLSDSTSSDFSKIAKIRIFMEKNVSINSFYNGKTPLMYACQYCKSTEVINILLEYDANTTIRSSEGKTAFDYAMENTSLIHDENFWKLNRK